MDLPAAGNNTGAYLGGVAQTSADITASVAVSAAPSATGTDVYVSGRRVNGVGEYRFRVRFFPNGTVGLVLSRLQTGVAEAFPGGEVVVPGLTYTPGTTLNLRVQVFGTGTTTARAPGVDRRDRADDVADLAHRHDGRAAGQRRGGPGGLPSDRQHHRHRRPVQRVQRPAGRVSGPDAPRRSSRSLMLRRVLPALLVFGAALALFLVLQQGNDDQETPGTRRPRRPARRDRRTSSRRRRPSRPGRRRRPSNCPRPRWWRGRACPASARTLTVSAADFAAPAEWSDGASIRVTDARQQVTSGRGPGERAGQPQTLFTLELVNGTGAALDLNAVVVQAVYGGDKAQASPLYDAETVDFGGSLAPGGTATAVYSFAIPADQVGNVVLSVDVDGYRFPAVFSGAVPVG